MKSAEVEQLLEDLRGEKPRNHVTTHADSKMVIVIEDTGDRFVFDAKECELTLSSAETVQRLFEAMDYPDEAIIELHDLVIDPEVMSELEALASTVDEM